MVLNIQSVMTLGFRGLSANCTCSQDEMHLTVLSSVPVAYLRGYVLGSNNIIIAAADINTMILEADRYSMPIPILAVTWCSVS